MLFTQIHSNVTSTSARHYDLLQTIVIEVGRVVSVGPGSGGDLLHGGAKGERMRSLSREATQKIGVLEGAMPLVEEYRYAAARR